MTEKSDWFELENDGEEAKYIRLSSINSFVYNAVEETCEIDTNDDSTTYLDGAKCVQFLKAIGVSLKKPARKVFAIPERLKKKPS